MVTPRHSMQVVLGAPKTRCIEYGKNEIGVILVKPTKELVPFNLCSLERVVARFSKNSLTGKNAFRRS